MKLNLVMRLFILIAIVSSFGAYLVPYSYSKGVSEWTLYGNVIDGNTCKPLQGAMVSAPYNSNTTNITNSSGGYLLRLGYGNWTVTISKGGYAPIRFTTPYVTSGGYRFDTYLVAPGTVALNCTSSNSLHGQNSTVPTTASVTTLPTTNPTTVQATQSQSGINQNAVILVGIIAVIVVVLIIIIYVVSKMGKKSEKKEQKEEGKQQA